MANHVHAVLRMEGQAAAVMKSIKGRSARRINLVLGRTGALWQRETYDRLVRDEREFAAVVRYVIHNPVAAGLVLRAEDYRWSSAWKALARGDGV